MKKWLALLLSVVICLSLSACALEDTPTKEEADTSAENTTKDEELIFGLNETAVFGDLKFTASELKESEGTDFFNPKSGNVFVGIKFTIENTSDKDQSVSSLLLFDGYVDDVKCDFSLSAACTFDEGSIDGTIAPGKKLVGWYALEVPKNWKNIELDVKANWLSNSKARFSFDK